MLVGYEYFFSDWELMEEAIENQLNVVMCRIGCAACCIAPSISSAIPGMTSGKPAGERCLQLTSDNRCSLFGHSERPGVCASLRPSLEMCGQHREEAIQYLSFLEKVTSG